MKRARSDVYEADEDDYEYDAYGRLVVSASDHETTLVNDAGRASISPPLLPPKAASPVDADPLALVKCYTSALQDYKLAHPSFFEPIRDRPKTMTEKQQFAPLWYGPPTIDRSNGNDSAKRASKKTKVQANGIATAHSAPNGDSHFWSPQSPKRQRAPSERSPSPPRSSRIQAESSSSASTTSSSSSDSDTSSSDDSSSSFDPQSLAQELPARAANPPAMQAPPAGDKAELLHNALMAWYNAGYATALYHASAGIVKLPDGGSPPDSAFPPPPT